MGTGRLLRACVVVLAFLAAAASSRPALAQANFYCPGGDATERAGHLGRSGRLCAGLRARQAVSRLEF